MNRCDEACLATDDGAARVGRLRRAWRTAAVGAAIALCWVFGVLSAACSRGGARRLLRWWTALYTRATGARFTATGERSPGAALLLANHVSSLDAMAVLATRPAVAVARRELADHPFLGRLSRNAGTIFVDQDSLAGVRALVEAITAELRSGNSVVVFPEGRVRCLPPGGDFRPSAVQAALDAGAPVVPVALWWELPGGRVTPRATWIGTEPLARSLRRITEARGLVMRIAALDALEPRGKRTELARRAHRAVADAAPPVPGTCAAHRTELQEVGP
ncbi:lysophospholipid acyltransferase family protein [Saccharopolyspora cebuensis]|uniref:Lysophospholipid acyltransferase family protein n=1 Tax=Saccharopolyspora cebuensis TaxID=418759 RepID=A0ABV4CPE4_9PSEU